MLEVLAGGLAALLAVIGLAIMAGPALPRLLGRRPHVDVRARPPGAAPSEVHPTTRRALAAGGRLARLLADNGLDRPAAGLVQAMRGLRQDEARGLHAMQQLMPRLRGLRMADEADQPLYAGLVGQLGEAVRDRAEQLELLPRP